MPINKPAVFFSQRLNNRFFRGMRDGVVLECGALDGITNSIGWWFEHNLGWTAVNVEPNSISFSMCEVNRPNAVNVEGALSNVSGTATLQIPEKPGHCTIEDKKFRGKTNTEEVTTMTYLELIEKYEIFSIDLFVLDVEGHELAVVEGMQGAEVWPSVICAETNKTSAEDLAAALSERYEIRGRDTVNTYFVRTV